MIETKTDFLTGLKTLIGDNTSDEVLDLLEYANKIDTDNDTEITSLKEQITNLENDKAKLQSEKEELDKSWRVKYRDTFYSSKPADDDNKPPKKVAKNFSDLFIEKE